MRRTRLIIVLLAGILAAWGGWILFGTSNEPKYDGEPVSYWFRRYCQLRGRRHWKAEDAIHKMGTNAVPFLLGQAINPPPDTRLRKNFYDILGDFPESWGLPKFVSSEDIQRTAIYLIREIEPPPNLVLPGLLKFLNEPDSPQFDGAISIVSRTSGDPVALVPYFTKALQATNFQTRLKGVAILGDMGPQAVSAIPDLLAVMRTTEGTNLLNLDAAFALGLMGTNALPALLALKKSYEAETNWPVRLTLAVVLCRIDPLQAEPFGYVVDSLTNRQSSDLQVRTAAWRLGFLGTNAAAAVPALLAADRTNSMTRKGILRCLDQIGAPPALFLPKLQAWLDSTDEEFRVGIAGRVLAIAPSHSKAQAVLVNTITNHSEFEAEAIASLGGAGTNARSFVPVILAVFNDTETDAWRSAVLALKKMGVSRDAYLPQLQEKLRSNDHQVGIESAALILEGDPADQAAQVVLMDLIKTKSKHEARAIMTLGGAGPPAARAIPLLHQELNSKKEIVREAAEDALEKIESTKVSK